MKFKIINFQGLVGILSESLWGFDTSVSALLNRAKNEEITIFEDRTFFNGNHSYEDERNTLSYHHPTGLVVLRRYYELNDRHSGGHVQCETKYFILENRL